MPVRPAGRTAEAPAKARRVNHKKIPGAHELAMIFLMPICQLGLVKEMFLSRCHRPEAGKKLVHEEAPLGVGISRLLDVLLDQLVLLLGGERQAQDGLGEIVGGIYYVELGLSHTVVFIIGFQQSAHPVDPFAGPHVGIDQGRKRARLLAKALPHARPHEHVDGEPSVGFAECLR